MDLLQRITPNTTLLTPNRRLAASLAKLQATEYKAQGIDCWETMDVLPLYPSWLERLWKTDNAQDLAASTQLLTTHQEQIIWEKIIRDVPENESLLQLTDTAKLAKSAWETLKRWGVNLTDPALTLTEDSRAFLQWASLFKNLCANKNWLDQNSLADTIGEKMLAGLIIPPQHLILVGFTEIATQYLSLLKICEKKGSQIEHYKAPSCNKTTQQIGIIDTENEIQTMARWAKSLSHQEVAIACIIPNLETLREKAIQTFNDVLGQNQFNISAGKSLVSYPIIHDALNLLNLNKKTLNLQQIRNLLRSPFVGEAEQERYKRAAFETRLQNLNVTTLALSQLLNPDVKYNVANTCPGLAKRLTGFLACIAQTEQLLPISQWVIIFSELLSELGWPGQRSLNSHEYQVVQNAWLPLLSEYAAFDPIMGPQTYHKALHYLNCLASNTVFQPESPETSVQILGLLEAADMPFEHAWVMGLDDTTWPSKPKPNPFIPLRLQKNLKMPNASAERELLYCQLLTQQLHDSAQHLTLSYPLQRDDAELRPSALLKNYAQISLTQLNLPTYTATAAKIYQTQTLEFLVDQVAPPIVDREKIYGGVRIFKAQADCPFKAFSELRLHARKMDEATLGLDKLDRGNIVHKALEFLWGELSDSNTLMLMPDHELKTLIHTCAQRALSDVAATHIMNNTRYIGLELYRLQNLLWDWLQLEKLRPPFKVLALEQQITATIGPITANFRVDRIDELLSENSAATQFIIDYKTAKDVSKKSWFGERLDEPQLPLYSLANPDQTIGIAFAKVNPHAIDLLGVTKSSLTFAAVLPLASVKQADSTVWQSQMQAWEVNLTKLATDFFQGDAKVDPKNGELTCRLCGLQTLCRIHELTDADEEVENDESI